MIEVFLSFGPLNRLVSGQGTIIDAIHMEEQNPPCLCKHG